MDKDDKAAGPSKPPTTPKPRGGKAAAKTKKVVFATNLVDEPEVVGAVQTASAAVEEEENLILQLKITPSNSHLPGDLCDNADGVDPPDAYDEGSVDRFSSRPSEIHVAEQSTLQPADLPPAIAAAEKQQRAPNGLRIVDLLRDFEEKTKHKEWPNSTSVHCYWCCHQFNTVPFGLPMKLVDENVFHVVGCFCSLSCAAAHNMASNDSMDEIWERQSLLHLLAKKIHKLSGGCDVGSVLPVKPAPNRLALKMFGGYLDIDDFRTHGGGDKNMKTVVLNFPPMVAITQQLEEMFENDITQDFKYIPLDHDRIDRYKEKLQLRRAKPLVNPKNTLDFSMNLTIQPNGS